MNFISVAKPNCVSASHGNVTPGMRSLKSDELTTSPHLIQGLYFPYCLVTLPSLCVH